MGSNKVLPIVFQALPKWDGAYNSTALTISKLLSENRKVFYIEHPFSYLDKLKSGNLNQLKKRRQNSWEAPFTEHPNFIVIHPPFTFPINKLSEGLIYNVFMNRYIKKLWVKIDSILRDFEINEFGYINSFDPVYFEFESEIKCQFKIYHSVDLISGEPYIARHGVKAEELASTKADRVVTTSYPLKDRLIKYNRKTECIPNAVDFNHFSKKYLIPEEFKSSNKKRLVYTGNVGLRIDYPLLEQIAKAYPDLELWIVGPKDPQYFKGMNLEKLPNVIFTGAKNYADLPAYIHYADVCIIPFECNELTYHIYPLKLNEYLSAGKPIVTSAFTNFGEFNDFLYVYNDTNEAIEKVFLALNEPNESIIKSRIEAASKNTWSNRISLWEKLIHDLECENSSIN